MSWADDLVKQCHGNLTDGYREALYFRGVTDDQLDLFEVGVFEDKYLPQTPPTFHEWWAGWKSRLKTCYMFPLTSWSGKVCGFQFKAMEGKVYTDHFFDSSAPAYFGLKQAAKHVWETGELTITEGVFDFFPVQRVIPGTISTLTAKFPSDLSRATRRFCHTLHVFYDRDEAGRKAWDNIRKYEKKAYKLHDVPYPNGVVKPDGKPIKDPGDLWETVGDQTLSEYLLKTYREHSNDNDLW